jgi:hypothetical protein
MNLTSREMEELVRMGDGGPVIVTTECTEHTESRTEAEGTTKGAEVAKKGKKVVLGGRDVFFAPLGFTEEAVGLLELFETMPDDAKDLKDFPVGRFTRLVHECLKQSLEDAGYSSGEIRDVCRCVKMGDGSAEEFRRIAAVMIGA